MKEISILGTGCPKCRKLYENAQAAVASMGVEASVKKVEKVADIVAYGVLTTPAIAVDGKVRSAGKVLSPEQITELLA